MVEKDGRWAERLEAWENNNEENVERGKESMTERVRVGSDGE